MFYAAFTIVALLSQPADATRFARCSDRDRHIVVQQAPDHYVVHFHLLATDRANKTIFARVRTQKEAPEGPLLTIVSTEVVPNGRKEEWSFYFRVPRYPHADPKKVTYQIEFGDIDLSSINEYVINDSFTWQIQDGELFTGTKDAPIAIAVSKRVIDYVEQRWVIRTVHETKTQAGSSLKYGMTTTISGSIDGDRAAKRLSSSQ
jgi:hypothetical protein